MSKHISLKGSITPTFKQQLSRGSIHRSVQGIPNNYSTNLRFLHKPIIVCLCPSVLTLTQNIKIRKQSSMQAIFPSWDPTKIQQPGTGTVGMARHHISKYSENRNKKVLLQVHPPNGCVVPTINKRNTPRFPSKEFNKDLGWAARPTIPTSTGT